MTTTVTVSAPTTGAPTTGAQTTAAPAQTTSAPAGLIHGWDVAALVSAVLCAIGALTVASCRPRG